MSKKELRKINLKTIENPMFLKDLSYKELDLLSHDIRSHLLETVSQTGGHLSSNLGVVEATISLCKNFDFNKDKIIFDVGHQSYTYKILTGRRIETLRQKDGISGFQKISESPYDHFECGHSSTSISAANGMAIARDLNQEDYEVIAFIGDASIVNGLAMEGLNNAAVSGHKIIIVLNDNDMSISKPVGGLAKSFRRFSTSRFYTKSKSFFRKIFPRFFIRFLSSIKNWIKRHVIAMNVFDILGYKVIGPIDGHDMKALDRAFKKAKRLDSSVVVHIKTIKGYGYKFAENDAEGMYHGVGKFDLENGLETSESASWSKFFGEEIVKTMDEKEETFLIVPATGNGSYLNKAFKKFPTRCLDVGIAEEHAVTLASALALSGKRPIISIYSTFLQRAYDEILHDAARMNAGITFLIDRAGLVGSDGDTHQGLYDETFIINMPNTIMAMPSNTQEASFLLKESFSHSLPFFIRYPKENIKNDEDNNCDLAFGKWISKHQGKDVAVVSIGPLTNELLKAIKDENIDATLIQALFLKPMDEEMIKSLLSYKKIIIYDAYSTVNGFIQSLEARLLELKYSGEVIKLGVDNVFVKHASVDEQRAEFSLQINDVIKLLK